MARLWKFTLTLGTLVLLTWPAHVSGFEKSDASAQVSATPGGSSQGKKRDGGGADAAPLEGADAGGPSDEARSDGGRAGEAFAVEGDEAAPSIVDIEAVPPPVPLKPLQSEVPKDQRPALLLRTIVGLLALLALAYLAGHRRVLRIEEALGVRTAITVGFPFVALGLIARQPAVGVLSPEALLALGPIIEFGLGWLGFLVGMRFDIRVLERVPKGTGAVVGWEMALPFLVTAVGCGAAMVALAEGESFDPAVRDGILLGVAAAMSVPVVAVQRSRTSQSEVPTLVQHLDEVVGVVGLALIAAYFRPRGVELSWNLPFAVWIFIALGMGTTFGVLAYLTLRRPVTQAESMALMLGSIALTAGMAAYVSLPPLVICFIAGVILANLPSGGRESLLLALGRVERPIYLIFFVIAGAMWEPADWRGWALLTVFVATRLVGLTAGIRMAQRSAKETVEGRPSAPAFAPLSIVSIAVIVSAQSLYQGHAFPWMMTAVIGGALASEIIAQLATRTSVAEDVQSDSGSPGSEADAG